MLRIKHGFPGQRLVSLPFYIEEGTLKNPLCSDLVLHSIGYFPKAHGHYINRPLGCNEYLLIYCTNGKGYYILNNVKHTVSENQFFILPAETPHVYGADENVPWSIYWVHFRGSKAPAIYEQLQTIRSIPVSEKSRISDRIALFDEILNILEKDKSSAVITYANMTLHYLIGSFLFVDIFRDARHIQTDTNNNTFLISMVTHYMSENIENKLTLNDLSNYIGYSESQIYRLFFKETNFAPITYFIHMKINRACQLLENTDLKVKQIALKLGFDDPYYFSRIFKKIIGQSPLKYKRNKAQNEKAISCN